MAQYDVTIDRASWIGGSDIPALMGISQFKTRYELLLEKAGLKENDFTGNKYTVYGQTLEPQIRDYINNSKLTGSEFVPNRVYKDDLRCHSDGFNGYCVLEIKTTSHIYKNVDDYKAYLVQLLLYMQVNEVEHGMLAVYKRPDDFSPVFDPKMLYIYKIDIREYKSLVEEINTAIAQFRADLERLKENPLLSEEDFQPNELVTLSNQVLAFENQLAQYKVIEQQYKDMKERLYKAMVKHDVKSWETVGGVKITRVDGSEPITETVQEFDEISFAMEYPDLYKDHCKEVKKKKNGKAGYVKITMPKG